MQSFSVSIALVKFTGLADVAEITDANYARQTVTIAVLDEARLRIADHFGFPVFVRPWNDIALAIATASGFSILSAPASYAPGQQVIFPAEHITVVAPAVIAALMQVQPVEFIGPDIGWVRLGNSDQALPIASTGLTVSNAGFA